MKRALTNPEALWLVVLTAVMLVACRGNATDTTPVDGQPYVPGTGASDEPLAAVVNGQPVTLDAYNREVARFQAGTNALGWEIPTDGSLEEQVLDLLIERELIRQEAARQGVVVTTAQIESEIAATLELSGSQQDFDTWLAANQWTLDEFRDQIQIELLTNQLTAPVLEAVQNSGEQVHARHILVDTEEQARAVLAELNNNGDFATLAAQQSRDATTSYNGGDLGWFPRGALIVREVEDASFTLDDGATSDVIASPQGYHIVQTLERDPNRPISPETHQRLLQNALDAWRASLWENAQVERLINAGS